MEIRYKTRKGDIVTARYDAYQLQEGERWVSTKKENEDDPVHHFVINENGEIVKGFGGKFNGLKPNEINNNLLGKKAIAMLNEFLITTFEHLKKPTVEEAQKVVSQIPNGYKLKIEDSQTKIFKKTEQGWKYKGTDVSELWMARMLYNELSSYDFKNVDIIDSTQEQKEYQKAMYPETIAGVTRGDAMTHEQADSGNINPNYDNGKGYNTNCQSCVVAYEMRLRGYDVEVLPRRMGNKLDDLAYNFHHAWVNKEGVYEQPILGINNGVTNPKNCLEWMEKTVQKGQRYIFENSWKGVSYGHVRILQRDDEGNLWLYDPQSDKSWKGEELAEAIRAIKIGRKDHTSPELLRIDNKGFSDEYKDAIVKVKK